MDDLTEFLDFSFHNMNNIQNGMDTDKVQKEYVNVRDKTFGTNALKTSDIFSNNLAFSATHK